MAPTIIKQKVPSNIGAIAATRFYNTIWSYRLCQLTTSNVKAMKDAPISMFDDSTNDKKKTDNAMNPVRSDLQPHALHTFVGDQHPSIVLAVPKSSDHYRNLIDCTKGSLMFGHTDPQLFHWFKQLGTLPPRCIVSGKMEVVTGDLRDDTWNRTFVRHPIIHNLAQEMWEKDQTKTEEEVAHINERVREEDEKRMRRMSSSDWRAKFKERESNPTPKDDEELPVYVIKPDAFALVRVTPEVRLWTNFCGQVTRVYDPIVPAMDPLSRASMRFIQMLNLSRPKLVSSLNINYNLKLTNAFVIQVDEKGLWAMGTQENLSEQNNAVKEQWTELRLEFGKDQVVKSEQEMEWWIRGLSRLGASEMSQTNTATEDAQLGSENDFRHI